MTDQYGDGGDRDQYAESDDQSQSRSHHQMALEIDYLRTAIGWQQVPEDELRLISRE